jgi:RNA polymerase sigma-70 factor (ECF subfamily)
MRPVPMAAVRVRANDEWVRELSAGGSEQGAALGDLRAYLLRAARYALQRHRGRLAHVGPADLDQMAEDCAQEALLAILARLKDFRGDSRFTTWAYKFAINMALVAARREAGKQVSLDALLDQAGSATWLAETGPIPADPERTARRAEAWAVLREVIEHELTDRQRQALKAVVVDEVPLDELVRHWGSNRNAVYKLLHDARRKLKSRLEVRGFAPGEVLALFGGPG